MSGQGPAIVYLLCLAASATCAGLLTRAYLQARSRLLLWTAVSFGLLALNNLLLVADLLIFPDLQLSPYRQASAAAAIGVLLYAFVWEVDR